MIKKLLFSIVLMLTFLSGSAQVNSVAVVGEAAGGWPTGAAGEVDVHQMSSTDGENWTLNDLVLTSALPNGGIKFRANNAWTINWGEPNNAFPTGTGVRDGGNIYPIAGTYDVTFNSTSGVYAFTGGPVVPVVKLIGAAVTPVEGVLLTTTNGIDYSLSNLVLTDGNAQFDVDGQIYTGGTFPAGVATTAIVTMPVVAGTYTVNINILTGVYNFAYPSIGFLGTVLGPDGFAGEDVDLISTDGINYQVEYALVDGKLKFRQDNSWSINWGGPGLSGVAEINGLDIDVVAGDYLISFNRTTLEYAITPALGIESNNLNAFTVSPNPTSNTWNFLTSNVIIDNISIYDFTGKLVKNVSPKNLNVTIDGSVLSSGLYFAKISTGNAVKTIKIVKQ